MSTSTLTARIIVMLALLALPVAASAQRIDDGATDRPSLSSQYETAFLTMALEFWTPKLNAYKIEIDRMLSASDLVEVNELRTRAALLLDQIQTMRKKEAAHARQTYSTTDTAYMATAAPAPDVAIAPSAPGFAEDYTEAGPTEQEVLEREKEWQRQREEQQRENVRQLEQILAGTTETVVEPAEAGENHAAYHEGYGAGYRIAESANQLRHVTRWIARNYRPGMLELMTKIFVDMDEFFEASRIHARDFVNARGRNVLSDDIGLANRITSTLRSLKEAMAIREGTGAQEQTIRSAIESVLMVYNGQDLREILMIDGSPVASTTVEKLPPGSMLGQNSPNPASTRTTIPYTLAEPGSRVLIQLLDTRSTLVATFDQGAREIGEHSASIDVSGLAPGTYLYQLKVTTSGGERVSSRGLQVVR